MRASVIPRLRKIITANAQWYNNRALWTVMALVIILLVNRLIFSRSEWSMAV